MMLAVKALVLLAASSAFETSYRSGLDALNRNDLPVAQARLEEAAKLEPKNPQVWLALSQVYFKQSKKPQADAAANRADVLGGDSPLILHGLAFFYTESREPAKAALFEGRYAEKAPDDPDAYPRAVDLYLRAELPKPAISLAQKGIARNPTAALYALLAKSYEADKQFDKALPAYQAALKLRPYDEAYAFEYAQALLRRQKFAEALAVLQEARARFDKSAQIRLAMGVALYGLRRFPETIDAFLETIQLDPEVEQPYIFLGKMIDVAEGKLPEVTGALAIFASARPQNYLSSFLYAKALSARQAEPEQVIPLLTKSIALNGKFWESHFEMGSALEKSKDWAGAAVEYKKSAELAPKEPTPHYRLARVYDRLGKRDEAAAERALHAKLAAVK